MMMNTAANGTITATGLRGYLMWLKQDQPGLYQRVANQIAQAVPKGFSDYNQALVRSIRVAAVNRRRMLSGLGQDSDADLFQSITFDPNSIDPSEVASLTDPFNLDTSVTGITMPTISYAPTQDVATAANTGSTASTIASAVSSIVNTAANTYLSSQQAQAYQQLNQAQLQRAAAGLPPLSVTSTGQGIPLISGVSSVFSGSSGGLLLIGLLVVGAVALSGKKHQSV